MLPSSGIIKMSEVNTELKTSGSISLNRSDVRKLASKISGVIKMSDLYGKSAVSWIDKGIFEFSEIDMDAYNATYSVCYEINKKLKTFGKTWEPTNLANLIEYSMEHTGIKNKEYIAPDKQSKLLIIEGYSENAEPDPCQAYIKCRIYIWE